MIKIFGLLFILTLLGGLSSCATEQHGILLEETPLNMSDSRKIVISVIGKPREISENGREIFSGYTDDRGLDFDPVKHRERFYTHVLILNDRRPYDIRVIVPVEEKKGKIFVLVGYDEDKAKRTSEKIKKALNQSRENRNFIDDFKAY